MYSALWNANPPIFTIKCALTPPVRHILARMMRPSAPVRDVLTKMMVPNAHVRYTWRKDSGWDEGELVLQNLSVMLPDPIRGGIGDGFSDCEDQSYGCDLSCYDNDGGDCEGGGSD